MRIPKKFTVKGKQWRVVIEPNLVHEDGTECDGLCDFENRIIYLDSTLKRRKKKAIFFHELCHILVYEAHINPGVRFSEGVEEILCDAFSDLLITANTNMKWKR